MFFVILLIIPGLMYSCLIKLFWPRTENEDESLWFWDNYLMLVLGISLKCTYHSVSILYLGYYSFTVFRFKGLSDYPYVGLPKHSQNVLNK